MPLNLLADDNERALLRPARRWREDRTLTTSNDKTVRVWD